MRERFEDWEIGHGKISALASALRGRQVRCGVRRLDAAFDGAARRAAQSSGKDARHSSAVFARQLSQGRQLIASCLAKTPLAIRVGHSFFFGRFRWAACSERQWKINGVRENIPPFERQRRADQREIVQGGRAAFIEEGFVRNAPRRKSPFRCRGTDLSRQVLSVRTEPRVSDLPLRKFSPQTRRLVGDRRHGLLARRSPPQFMQPVAEVSAEISD